MKKIHSLPLLIITLLLLNSSFQIINLENQDTNVYDEVIQIEDDNAYETARLLAKEFGLFVGISTGANVYAAIELAKRVGPNKKILTVSPSNAERYLSTKLFDN